MAATVTTRENASSVHTVASRDRLPQFAAAHRAMGADQLFDDTVPGAGGQVLRGVLNVQCGVRESLKDDVLAGIGLLVGGECVAEEDRDNMAAAIGEQDDFTSHRVRFEYSFAGGDQDQTLGVAKGDFADFFPVVTHGVLGAVQEDVVAFLLQTGSEVDSVRPSTRPVVGNEEVVSPQPVTQTPIPRLARPITADWQFRLGVRNAKFPGWLRIGHAETP